MNKTESTEKLGVQKGYEKYEENIWHKFGC